MAVLHGMLKVAFNVGLFNEFQPLFSYLASKSPKNSLAGLCRYARKSVETARVQDEASIVDFSEGKPATMLQKMFQAVRKQPDKYSANEMFTVGLNNIGAGSDTIGLSSTSIIFNTYRHPNVLRKLREEPGDRVRPGFKFQDTAKLPYLQAILKEGMRIHPGVGVPLERVVPPQGALLCCQFFPGGTIVGANAWCAHRDPEVWGEEFDQFRPERWLIEDKEKLSLMGQNWFPFGLGSRTCIGKNISLLEINKLVPQIVTNFDIELSDEHIRNGYTTHTMWFSKPWEVIVRVHKRIEAGVTAAERGV